MRSKITLAPEALSREDQIKLLQDKLRDAAPRAAAALQRRISLLQGVEVPYDRRPVAERKPIEPELTLSEMEDRQEREYQAQDRAFELDPEHTILWWKIYLIEQLSGCQPSVDRRVLKRRFDAMSPDEQQSIRDEAEREHQLRHQAIYGNQTPTT